MLLVLHVFHELFQLKMKKTRLTYCMSSMRLQINHVCHCNYLWYGPIAHFVRKLESLFQIALELWWLRDLDRGISFFPCCYSCFPFIRIDIFQKRWSVTFIKRWSLFMTQESKSSFLRYTHIHSCDFPNLECLLHHSLFWRRSRRKLAYICNLHNF